MRLQITMSEWFVIIQPRPRKHSSYLIVFNTSHLFNTHLKHKYSKISMENAENYEKLIYLNDFTRPNKTQNFDISSVSLSSLRRCSGNDDVSFIQLFSRYYTHIHIYTKKFCIKISNDSFVSVLVQSIDYKKKNKRAHYFGEWMNIVLWVFERPSYFLFYVFTVIVAAFIWNLYAFTRTLSSLYFFYKWKHWTLSGRVVHPY